MSSRGVDMLDVEPDVASRFVESILETWEKTKDEELRESGSQAADIKML